MYPLNEMQIIIKTRKQKIMSLYYRAVGDLNKSFSSLMSATTIEQYNITNKRKNQIQRRITFLIEEMSNA